MNWKRNLWSLWLGCILSSASYTMIIPFLPLYLLDLGATEADVTMWSGLVFSVTFLVCALLAPYWGRRADKDGKRRMVIRAGICLAVVYFLGSLVHSPLELFGVRLLQGFAAGFVPASMAIVASSVPEEKMGFSLGIMQTSMLTGSIIGPLFGGVLSHIFGIRASFVVAAAGIFCGTVAVRLLVTEPEREATPQTGGSVVNDLKTAFRNRLLREMLLLIIIVQMAVMALQPLITLYVAQLQGQLEGAGLVAGIVFSLAGIAGAIAAPLWGRIGQKKGFFTILSLAFLGAGIFNICQYFGQNIWQFGVLQFIYGLFLAGIYPALNTVVVNSTDENFRGRAFGLTMSANQVGSMLGPLLGGAVSVWLGIRPVFICAGAILLLTGIAARSRYGRG